MSALELIDMCEKHEVRFYRGVCDICVMLETIALSRRMFELAKDALCTGKHSDAHKYIDAALNALPRPLHVEEQCPHCGETLPHLYDENCPSYSASGVSPK